MLGYFNILCIRFHTNENKFNSIHFDTQKYFKEALRISSNPHCYNKNEKNPIFSYVPANLEFVATKKDPSERSKSFQKEKDVFGDSIFDTNEETLENETEIKKLSAFNNKSKFSSRKNLSSLKHKYTIEKSKNQVFSETYNEKPKKVFLASFMPETCHSLKLKLSQKEPVSELYIPPSKHQFRDEEIPENKPLFKTRFQLEMIDNPFNLSQHDSRPIETVNRELKEKLKKEKSEEEKMNRALGISSKGKREWMLYFKNADITRNFVDHKYPDILHKDAYSEPIEIVNNLLRSENVENQENQEQFRLFHRPLTKHDKRLLFGGQSYAR